MAYKITRKEKTKSKLLNKNPFIERIAKKKITFATLKKHGVVLLKKSWVVSSFQLLLRLRFKCTLIFMPRKVSFVLFVTGISYFAFISIGLTIEGRWSQLIPVEESLVIAALLTVIFSLRIRDFYCDDRCAIRASCFPFLRSRTSTTSNYPRGKLKDTN